MYPRTSPQAREPRCLRDAGSVGLGFRTPGAWAGSDTSCATRTPTRVDRNWRVLVVTTFELGATFGSWPPLRLDRDFAFTLHWEPSCGRQVLPNRTVPVDWPGSQLEEPGGPNAG